jgi:hypothetical protein
MKEEIYFGNVKNRKSEFPYIYNVPLENPGVHGRIII